MKRELDDRTKKLLLTVCNHFADEDRAVRERQIRQWKKLKYYWDGFYRLWWSEVAHDWRVVDEQVASGQDNGYYDKPVNVFKAYLESIIAALSASIPDITCFPDDADSPLDLQTARAGDKIYELVKRHNNATELWLHALFIMCTEGMAAAYNYSDSDEKYGTYEVDNYKDVEEEQTTQVCPLCKTPLQPADIELNANEQSEYDPDNDDVLAHGSGPFCSNCLVQVDPELQTEKVIIQRFVGKTTNPKSRQCIEVFGGLFVKVANYARNQAGTPYLQWSYETHYSNVIERYSHLRDKLREQGGTLQGGYSVYEQWGRVPIAYYNEYPIHNCTVRNTWLRPCSFNVLPNEDDVKHLNKLFPDGAKVVLINQDTFAEACNEDLDDHWTLTYHPLSDYIHFDPLGKVLTVIQDITNDLVSLTIQTIEHGVGQTFVDPGVVDLEAYSQMEVMPGGIYPAIPKSGQKVGDAFFEVKTATLSGEVIPVQEKIQEIGQLISGALPTIFGGTVPNSSKTASQYSMMRAQSLQRLQTHWTVLSIWWKTIWGKVIPAYIKDVAGDEKFVTQDKQGNFANVLIKKAELDGKLGSVELESSENLPISWSQRREIIMTLLQAANPEVMAAMSSPENIPILQQALGLTDFHIPGEDDREKQLDEIRLLLQAAPISMPLPQQQMQPGMQQPGMGQSQQMGQPQPGMQQGMQQQPQMGQQPQQELPTVEVEPLLDNHQLEADTCRYWALSDAGRQAKKDNPEGYKNVLLHMQQHIHFYQMSQQAQQQPQQPGMPQQGPRPNGPDQNKQNQNQFKPVAQPVNNNVNRATQ